MSRTLFGRERGENCRKKKGFYVERSVKWSATRVNFGHNQFFFNTNYVPEELNSYMSLFADDAELLKHI